MFAENGVSNIKLCSPIMRELLSGKIYVPCSEYNETEYKSIKRSLLRLEKDSKTFEDLYDKRLITKQAMREGLKNVHQQRIDYLTVIADKVDHKVNWYALGKKAKNKLLCKYIERIDVSLKSKSISRIKAKL